MSNLDKIKLKLGISHTAKDAAIMADMDTAREEMIRAGVHPDVATSDDKLVVRAVETYVLMEYSDPELRERYENAFETQVNNLRKSESRWGDV